MASPNYDNYGIASGGTLAVIKARPGYLGKLSIVAAVTGTLTIYDHASSSSGDVLYAKDTPAKGEVIDLSGLRAKVGITVVPGTAGTVLISFT